MSESSTQNIINAIEDVQDEEILFKATVQKRKLQRMREEVEQSEIVDTPSKAPKRLSKEEFFYEKLDQNQISEIDGPTKPKKQESPSYLPCDKEFKHINTVSALKICYDSIGLCKPTNSQEEYIKRVYQDIIGKHAETSWIFTKERIDMMSEQDFTIKFWGSVFETYLGSNEKVMLNWGEKMSPLCKNKGLDFKFDLRILVVRNNVFEDVGLGEAAKKATQSKYFNDRVKGAIASKVYLNHFLKSIPYITYTTIPKVTIPFIQLMGLDATISTLTLTKKGQYSFQDVYDFSYPRSLPQIKNGDIQSIIKGMTLLKNIISDLESIYNDGQVDNSNQMSRMRRAKAKKSKFNIESWVTEVAWSKDDNAIVNGSGAEEEEED